MQLKQRRQALLQLHLSGEQFIAYHGAAYIRCLKVMLIFAEIDITAWELYIAIGPNIDKMDAILQTKFSNVLRFKFRFKFYRSLFLTVQLTICQHWSR